MNSKRRALLAGSLALPFARAFAQHDHPRPVVTHPRQGGPLKEWRRFVTPLRKPGQDGLMSMVDAKEPLRLTARYARHGLFPGRPTDLLVYQLETGGRLLSNPTLRVRRGEAIDATLGNRSGEDSTIHWHGLFVDERNDGSGMHPVRHNESRSYAFKVANRAGLYWYHPHPHDRTGYQVHLGMGGLLLVEDDEEDALRKELGVEPGDTEVALLLQDKQVDDRNRIRFSMGEDDWIGNRVMVNYTPEPCFEARTCLYRFRILNGSNARTYLLAFVSGGRKVPYTLIGTDGGLLGRAQTVTELYLAPAQRIDLVIDFEKLVAGSSVMMTSLAYDPMENDAGAAAADPMLEHPGAVPLGQALDLMRIDLKVPVCAPRKVPSRIASIPAAPRAAGKPRTFRLHLDGTRWLINGVNYHDDMRAVHVRVRRGAKEIWEIRNDMKSMPHPMHLHGFMFRVVERRESPPQLRRLALTATGLTAQDLGWLDTVLVWPGETVRIAIDFSQPFTGTQRYMFHCHNLEHEDQGMMLNFSVEA